MKFFGQFQANLKRYTSLRMNSLAWKWCKLPKKKQQRINWIKLQTYWKWSTLFWPINHAIYAHLCLCLCWFSWICKCVCAMCVELNIDLLVNVVEFFGPLQRRKATAATKIYLRSSIKDQDEYARWYVFEMDGFKQITVFNRIMINWNEKFPESVCEFSVSQCNFVYIHIEIFFKRMVSIKWKCSNILWLSLHCAILFAN